MAQAGQGQPRGGDKRKGGGEGQWQTVTIAAGQSESQEIPIPAAQLNVPRGQVSNAAGQKLVGDKGVGFDVQDSAAGSKIVLQQPATENVTFSYKQKGEDDDEEEDEGDVT